MIIADLVLQQILEKEGFENKVNDKYFHIPQIPLQCLRTFWYGLKDNFLNNIKSDKWYPPMLFLNLLYIAELSHLGNQPIND